MIIAEDGYADSNMMITNVHFAHRSLLFTIRTVSQTQNAAKATPEINRAKDMPGYYP